MKEEIRINIRVDRKLKDELQEVAEKTGWQATLIVREGVKEKLRSLKNTHPAYTDQVATTTEA